MTGHGSNYRPGIGVPAYLLDRNDNDSGIYSNDASITINSSRSTTPANDTYSLTSVSSYNITSVSSWSMNTEVCATSNSFASCIRKNQSTRTNISSSVSAVQPKNDNSVSVLSFLIGAVSNSTQRNNDSFSGSEYYNQLPPGYTDPADMFTPYVPLFTIAEEVPRRREPSPG